MEKEIAITTYPVVALRGLSVFPGMTVNFDVGRPKSIHALDNAMKAGRKAFLVKQKDIGVFDPGMDDLCAVGTVVTVDQILKSPTEGVRVMVTGVCRGRLVSVNESFTTCQVEELPAPPAKQELTVREEALLRTCISNLSDYLAEMPKQMPDLLVGILSSNDLGYVADYIAQNVPIKPTLKQKVLEEIEPLRRLVKVSKYLRYELEVQKLERDISARAQEEINKNHREYMLREQIRILKDELGEGTRNDTEVYRDQILALKLAPDIEKKLLTEVSRLEAQPFGSAEGAVLRTYIETVIELPWNKKTREKISVQAASRQLEKDHYGLEKVKKRILEFLAVKELAPDIKGQIICLVGPPGVGKTSVAMSIAKALNRKLARLSLGGIRDEAEIRGHRKTYVGAMPGRIMTAIRQCGSKNPLLLLDEIDKLSSDLHGDPSAALLEVLDTEQNYSFRDHYIEVPFDLSEVMFITTANTTDTIPRALLDRMEVIELGSYTDEEKLMITKRHLLPKQSKRHGLTSATLRVSDNAIRELIAGYTRESGVRNLERELAGVCRKAAMFIASGQREKNSVTPQNLTEYAGTVRFLPEKREQQDEVGVVTGLAWTQVGGEILKVEVNAVPGTGKLELTGNLGDVMKESVHAAVTYIRSRANAFGIDPDFYKNTDIHVHFPEAAVPKDGPSAGITIATAIVSTLTDRPVRADIAMTGEISIRGRVLPIGGLREKTMAALRSGIKTVIIPADNEKDLAEIDPLVRNAMEFVCVKEADKVMELAIGLTAEKKPTAHVPVTGGEKLSAGGEKS